MLDNGHCSGIALRSARIVVLTPGEYVTTEQGVTLLPIDNLLILLRSERCAGEQFVGFVSRSD